MSNLSLVWLDYRLAFVLLVIVPVVISLWGLFQRVLVVNTLMKIYWRVASLFLITMYLAIGGSGLAFGTGLLARILIPLALWFWIDINEEIADLPPSKGIKIAVTAWRWATTAYCAIGAVGVALLGQCAVSNAFLKTDTCQAWFQPPLAYQRFLHATAGGEFLGALGTVALVIYGCVLGYFVVMRLGKQGRMAMDAL
jgi:hypothetical protein